MIRSHLEVIQVDRMRIAISIECKISAAPTTVCTCYAVIINLTTQISERPNKCCRTSQNWSWKKMKPCMFIEILHPFNSISLKKWSEMFRLHPNFWMSNHFVMMHHLRIQLKFWVLKTVSYKIWMTNLSICPRVQLHIHKLIISQDWVYWFLHENQTWIRREAPLTKWLHLIFRANKKRLTEVPKVEV